MEQSEEDCVTDASAMRYWILEVMHVLPHEAHRRNDVRHMVITSTDDWSLCGFRQCMASYSDGSEIWIMQDGINIK